MNRIHPSSTSQYNWLNMISFALYLNISVIHRQRDYPNLFLKDNKDSIQEILFQAEIDESHTAQIIDMLVEIGQEFPDLRHSIIESLSQERIDIQI